MGVVPFASPLTVATSPHTSLTKSMQLSKRGFSFPLVFPSRRCSPSPLCLQWYTKNDKTKARPKKKSRHWMYFGWRETWLQHQDREMGVVPIASPLTVATSPHASLTKYMQLSKHGFSFPLVLPSRRFSSFPHCLYWDKKKLRTRAKPKKKCLTIERSLVATRLSFSIGIGRWG